VSGVSKTDSSEIETAVYDSSPIAFPGEWTLSESWQRAQTEADKHGSWINDAERMVWLEGSDQPHRVTFVLVGRALQVDCCCDGYYYRDWCAHVAKLWWQWIRGRLTVKHARTDREYQMPPDWLRVCETGESRQYDSLTSGELDAYLTCELGNTGVRECAQKTDRSPGTVGNLLSRARDKAGGQA